MSRASSFLFARHAHGPVTPAHVAQLEHLVAIGDRAASDLLPTTGNRFDLVDRSTDYASGLVADIDAAEHQVNLTAYGVKAGKVESLLTEPVLQALERRADEVPVTTIMDQVGSSMLGPRRANRQLVERLRDNGVQTIVRELQLGRGPLDDARIAVDHRKMAEIDGRAYWGGGENLVDDWAGWHDLMQRVEGPMAAQGGAVLAARWRDLGGEVTPARIEVLRRGLQAPTDDARHATRLLTDGNRHRRELSDAFVETVKRADERLLLTDPYLADPRAMEEIVRAARRLGPDAELFLPSRVVDGDQSQDFFTDPLRRAWAFKFADAGGRVHVLDHFSHAKSWIIDDVLGVGSHNKERGSMRRNYENLTATNDPVAVAQGEAAFDRQRARSLEGSTDVVEGWAANARWRDRLGLQY